MPRLSWSILPLSLFILLALVFWRGLSLDPHQLPYQQLGNKLPQFAVPQLLDREHLFSTNSLPKKVILLNVWASWCQACLEEQAFLMDLAAKKVPIYGLNYKDSAQDAKAWLSLWGNPYQQIGQDSLGKVGIELGVYGAPETFIIDKQGIIRYRHVGALTPFVWEHTLAPLMQQWEKAT